MMLDVAKDQRTRMADSFSSVLPLLKGTINQTQKGSARQLCDTNMDEG